MIGPLLKFATGLLLVPEVRTEKVVSQVSQVELSSFVPPDTFASELPALPPGCEDYRLYAGNITRARIFLMGEHHQFCSEARQKCSKGLLALRMPEGIDPDRSTLLFEKFSAADTFPCKEMGNGMAELSNDCRGWNLPGESRPFDLHPMKIAALREIATYLTRDLPQLSDYPETVKKEITSRYLKQWIDEVLKRIRQYQQELRDMRGSHKENYSISRERKTEASLAIAKFTKRQLDTIHGDITAGKPISTVVPELNKAMIEFYERDIAYIRDSEQSVRKPNKFMIKAIRAVSREKITFVYAGRAHISPEPIRQVENEKEAAKRQKIIAELYGELAHTNPYAVLSCTRKP